MIDYNSKYLEMVPDSQIDSVWGNANFGQNTNKREIIADTLLKYMAGFSSGHTAMQICQELGLLGSPINPRKVTLTKKGGRYLYAYIKATKTIED